MSPIDRIKVNDRVTALAQEFGITEDLFPNEDEHDDWLNQFTHTVADWLEEVLNP